MLVRVARGNDRSVSRFLAAVSIVPLIIFGPAACADSGEGAVSGGGSVAESPESNGDADDSEDTTGQADSLDSDSALAGGVGGDFAAKCDYDDNDGIAGTIFFYGPEHQRFEGLNANGVMSNILMFEGRAYAWADGSGEGARYPDPEASRWFEEDDVERLRAHSSNCVRFDDLSVFELPDSVAWTDIPSAP